MIAAGRVEAAAGMEATGMASTGMAAARMPATMAALKRARRGGPDQGHEYPKNQGSISFHHGFLRLDLLISVMVAQFTGTGAGAVCGPGHTQRDRERPG